MRELVGAIEENLGCRPTSHRAGRFGFDRSTVPVLEALGFRVDSSVHPLWWDGERGGPDHARAPQWPYRLDAGDACRPGAGGVVEVPLNRVIVGRHGGRFESFLRWAPKLHGLRYVMCRLGLGTLSPELHDVGELRRIARTIAARGWPLFHIIFHSSSALPGASPYVDSERALDAFAARLEALIDEIRSRWQAVPLGLSEVPAHLGDRILSSSSSSPPTLIDGRVSCASAS